MRNKYELIVLTCLLSVGVICGPAVGAKIEFTGDNYTWPADSNYSGDGPVDIPYGARVGYHASGSFLIQNGGVVNVDESTRMGYDDNTSGEITVTGSDSLYSCSGEVYMGYGDGSEGTITVSGGGRFYTEGNIRLSQGAEANCEITVTGEGTTLEQNASDGHSITVGWGGNSTLRIEDGADVTATEISTGYNWADNFDNSITGTTIVSGNGSTVVASDFHANYYGNRADSYVTVEDGATVAVSDEMRMNTQQGYTTDVSIQGAGSIISVVDVNLYGGTLSLLDSGVYKSTDTSPSLGVDIRFGDGTLAVNDSDYNYSDFVSDQSGNSASIYNGSDWEVVDESSDLTFSSGSGDYAGYTLVSGGQVVPEPGSIAVILVGVVGFIARRKISRAFHRN